MDIYNLISFAGIFVLLEFAWLLSVCVAGTLATKGSILLGSQV
jgi:hypothetical protein